jgi:hypothetical protein
MRRDTLSRIYTGSPQSISPQATTNTFSLDIVGAIGQHIVTLSSTDLLNWTSLATNNIADGASMSLTDSGLAGVPSKYCRLKRQQVCSATVLGCGCVLVEMKNSVRDLSVSTRNWKLDNAFRV